MSLYMSLQMLNTLCVYKMYIDTLLVSMARQERIKGEGAYNVKYQQIERAALNLGDYVR